MKGRIGAVRVLDLATFRLACGRCGHEWTGARRLMRCARCHPHDAPTDLETLATPHPPLPGDTMTQTNITDAHARSTAVAHESFADTIEAMLRELPDVGTRSHGAVRLRLDRDLGKHGPIVLYGLDRERGRYSRPRVRVHAGDHQSDRLDANPNRGPGALGMVIQSHGPKSYAFHAGPHECAAPFEITRAQLEVRTSDGWAPKREPQGSGVQ